MNALESINGLLTNKTIFLTGGSTGIGLECAKDYAREGALAKLISRVSEILKCEERV
jgi:NAD(P)-dependent dehydrogenase (short-subunit alcohol dehydrogenase family)